MRRCHGIPFGAEVLPDGVRFRLWAPAARDVSLCLRTPHGERALAMPAIGAGWFDLVTADAHAGSRYRYQIDGGIKVPDPASRFNPDDVHGPSEVIDPVAYEWGDAEWRGRPWHGAVVYELHVGTFTPEGTFAGLERRLNHLADLGVTAIELMPIAAFPGRRNWGYDGVLLFAPDAGYGTPDDLKRLIQAAHARSLMVFLDVVYNHFGPEGNYLHAYAPPFFTERYHTPWGAAINYDGEASRTVRDFFVHNALYWLEEFHLDGLRFDAVHAICDDSSPDILEEIGSAVRAGPGRSRYVHLVLENEHNAAHYLRPMGCYDAQWNDDLHHALHVLVSDEHDGYYADYADRPIWHLGRCLAEGFAYQGDPSPFRQGALRGEPSRDLPPTAFISFMHNHDQIGNRAFGERLTHIADPQRVRTAVAILLLAPQPPLMFMGEEWAASTPFLYFCDFQGDLAIAVTQGRRREFSRYAKFSDPEAQAGIPNPNDPATYIQSVLNWSEIDHDPHREHLAVFRELLALRRLAITPRLAEIPSAHAAFTLIGTRGLQVAWILGDGARLSLLANLARDPLSGVTTPLGSSLYATDRRVLDALAEGRLPPWSVAWFLQAAP
ncbi:MAG: malto-oligosyltrehalose trehalohydrolase [Gammaproteobacteria bacterium]